VLRKLRHKRCIAWLAMVAMWLTIVAPVVSRVLPDSQMSPALGAWCTGHVLSNQHPSSPSDPTSSLDHCGYCTLLGHSPLVSGDAIVFSPPALPAAVVLQSWVFRASYTEPVLSANPRGPPLLRHG
jgi:hypothetical protein